jgi:uncharacterized protein YbaR (Trm112 family)/SAM-dependent methyltransferase
MRERLLDFICCPESGSHKLELHVFEREDEHILEGVIRTDEGRFYPIVDGVPRMLPPELYFNPTFETRHRKKLHALGWVPPAASVESDEFRELKQATSQVYGFEWTRWDRHGWTRASGPLPHEVDTFFQKSLLKPEEIRGKVVLDAGSGNGRYAYTAAQQGAELIALDLSAAVESSFKNLRDLPNAHVVQGDIMKPPIRSDSIDHVYSIGVLMITGDTRRATESLARIVKPEGTLTVHVYAVGWPLWQFNDYWVRKLTTALSIPVNVKLAKQMSVAARWLKERGWLGYASLVLRMWPEDAVNFDWYATPLQTYHTHPEMRGWFRDMGWEVVADQSQRMAVEGGALRQAWVRTVWPDPMATVKGRKPAHINALRPRAAGSALGNARAAL